MNLYCTTHNVVTKTKRSHHNLDNLDKTTTIILFFEKNIKIIKLAAALFARGTVLVIIYLKKGLFVDTTSEL